MNKKVNAVYLSLVILLFPCIQALATENTSYDLEFKFINKVILSNDASIYPTEFWSLRDDYLEQRNKNKIESSSLTENENLEEQPEEESSGLFDLTEAIQAISKDQNEFIQILPQDHQDIYKARLDQLIEISETALLMKKDLWHEDYVNNLLKHVIGLRAAGISEKLPKFLWNPRIININNINIFADLATIASSAYDENFRRFGVLRSYLPEGKDKEKWLQPSPYQSVVWDLRQYMINEGADEDFIKRFAEESKRNINRPLPMAVKGFLMEQRNVSVSSYYRGSEFGGLLSDKESNTVLIWHAFTQEILKNTQFRHQNREKKTVRVMRTLNLNKENLENIATPKGEGKYTMLQGIFDSVGVFFPFSPSGTITLFEVPNHRILGLFFMEKSAGFATAGSVQTSGLFAWDFENEFLAMLEGIPFEIASFENLDLNGDTTFDSYVLNYYYQNKFKLIDDSYARENLDTMLINALFFGDVDAARLFLELGANPNVKDKYGLTPLLNASEQGDMAIVSLFLDKGANANVKGKSGKTPLLYAFEQGDMALVSLLLDKGADIKAKDNDGKMPLHYASEKGDMALASLLLDKGADVNVKDRWANSPLHYASQNGDMALVSLLLDKGADVNAKDKSGKTPLHYAAQQGDMALVSLFLDKGADVNAKDSSDSTPLHYAAQKGDMALVSLLLDKGADVNAKDNLNRTPLDIAKIYDRAEIDHLLEEKIQL